MKDLVSIADLTFDDDDYVVEVVPKSTTSSILKKEEEKNRSRSAKRKVSYKKNERQHSAQLPVPIYIRNIVYRQVLDD